MLFIVKESAGYDMYGDMTSIPSMTVLSIIDKARNCPEQTSVQLKETLENAGIIHPKKGTKLSSNFLISFCFFFLPFAFLIPLLSF